MPHRIVSNAEKRALQPEYGIRMVRLNGYLHSVGSIETDRCVCDQAKETVEHFLFRYFQWDQCRVSMFLQSTRSEGKEFSIIAFRRQGAVKDME